MSPLSYIVLAFAAPLLVAATEVRRFGVNQWGLPNFRVELFELNGFALCPVVSLQHALVFDGKRYVSRVLVPDLTSYLIKDGPSGYEWKKLGAGTHRLQPGRRLSTPAGRYLLENVGSAQVVRAVDGGEEHHFVDGHLVMVRTATTMYRCESEGGNVTRITVDAIGREPRLLFERRHDDTLQKLTYFDGTGVALAVLGCDDQGNVVFCQDPSDPSKNVSIAYQHGLIAGLVSEETAYTYRWAQPEYREYAVPAQPPPPAVEFDGEFTYRVSRTNNHLRIRFSGEKARAQGTWETNLATGQYRLSKESR